MTGIPTTHKPDRTPDLSLIRDYTPDVQQAELLKPPYVTRFHKGAKHLYYIASTHECGIQTDTFKTVAKAIEDYKPDIIIVEGLESNASRQYQQGYIGFARSNEANGFANVFEGPYAALLAERTRIPFIGGEPTREDTVKEINKEGYSAKDMMAFELLRSIPFWQKEGLPMDEASVEKRAREALAHNPNFDFIPAGERLTFEEFKAWYQEHNDKPERGLLAFTQEDSAPMNAPGANYFMQMHHAICEVRDRNIVTTIGEAIANHNRVLVVYGSMHLLKSLPVFEKMFGEKGETMKIIEPDAPPAEVNYRNDWSQQPRNAPGRVRNGAQSEITEALHR